MAQKLISSFDRSKELEQTLKEERFSDQINSTLFPLKPK